jgi:MoaA/NifB/PqqE/SkfB family radical SAM enzyme
LYQSLILFLNRRCTVGCAACSAGALPGNMEELTPAWLTGFFKKIKQEPPAFSGYITWTGGEPFLSFDSLRRGIELASAAGYRSEILTGGQWFGERPARLEQLKDAGSFCLRISLDAEHQKQAPLSDVVSLIRRADALGMEVNFTLREIPGRNHSPRQSMEEIKTQLPEFYNRHHRRSRWLHWIPHIPFGSKPGPPYPDRTPCRMAFRDLVIGEDGLVYPCCGFFGSPSHHRFALGDPLKESWETLAAGTGKSSYYSPCHTCGERLKE